MVLLSYKDREPAVCVIITDVTDVVYQDFTLTRQNSQNDRVWSQGEKCDVVASWLMVQRAKFAQYITVTAGVSFVEKKAKINANYIHGQFVAEDGGRCSWLAGK